MKVSKIVLMLGLLPLLGSCDFFAAGVFCAPRHVNVKLQGGNESSATFLQVKPAQISVKQGCSFEIRFPAGKKAKTISGTQWLDNPVLTTSPIIVLVPPAEAKIVYKYDIEVEGFGVLDPRARVK
jgi:hypothetical protein